MNEQDVKTEVKVKQSIFDKTILEINDEVSINPFEISSLEETTDSYNYWGSKTSNRGTILTMKCGSKIFCAGMTRKEIRDKVDVFMYDRMK